MIANFDIIRNLTDEEADIYDSLIDSKSINVKQSLLDFITREEFTAVTEPCSSLLAPEHVDVVRTDTLREFIDKLFPNLMR